MRRFGRSAAVGGLLVVAGCSLFRDGAETPVSSSSSSASVSYPPTETTPEGLSVPTGLRADGPISSRALLEAHDWAMVGAGAVPGLVSDPAGGVWYVEYDGARIELGSGTYSVPHVMLTGYSTTVQEVAAAVLPYGYVLDPAPGGNVLIARAGPGTAAIVVFEVGGGTVSLLSYDLDGQALAALVPTVVVVADQEWFQATAAEYES